MENEIKIELVRLTKPTTLIKIAPRINELAQVINISNITYETLYVYFLKTVQQSEYLLRGNAKPLIEFTLALIEGMLVGYSHWYIKPIAPVMATACWDYSYIWNDEYKTKIEEAMTSRFIAFGRRNKCEFFEIEPNIETALSVIESKKLSSEIRTINKIFIK
jgi:hypothetical protein